MDIVENLYGFEVSAEMISNITDKIISEMEEWKTRSKSDILSIRCIEIAQKYL